MNAAVDRRKYAKIFVSDIKFPFDCGPDYTAAGRAAGSQESHERIPRELDDQQRDQHQKDLAHEAATVGHRINRSGHEGCQQQEQQFVLCKSFNKNYK